MHEENLFRSWSTEDGKRKKKEYWKRARRPTKEEMGKKRRREEETEENETVRCVGSVSVEAFDHSVKGEIWRVVVIFLVRTLWRSLRIGHLEPETRLGGLVVPGVTDVCLPFFCGH